MKPIEFDLGLPDEGFWGDYAANEIEVRKKFRLVMDHMTRIGAPKEIDLGNRKTFPLVIYQNGSPKDFYHYNLESSGLVAAVDVERNILFYAVAVKKPEYKPPRKETNDDSYATLTHYMVDLQDRLRMELKPGKYLTVIINREDVTNRVETVVKAASDLYKDEEVEKFIEEHRKKAPIPEVWPPFRERPKKTPLRPLSLPIYAKYEGSPEIPKENGISVEPTRVQFAKKDAVCLIRGSFRLPSAYGQFVPPDQRSKDNTQPVEYLRMPIHLIVTGEKSANPFNGRLMIPVYDKVKDRKEDKPVTGHFAFDLLKHADLTEIPQTYFLYLFSGEVMVGPLPFAFVDPKEVEP